MFFLYLVIFSSFKYHVCMRHLRNVSIGFRIIDCEFKRYEMESLLENRGIDIDFCRRRVLPVFTMIDFFRPIRFVEREKSK